MSTDVRLLPGHVVPQVRLGQTIESDLLINCFSLFDGKGGFIPLLKQSIKASGRSFDKNFLNGKG